LVSGTFFEKALGMKVLVTGVYDPGYNRNRVLVSGLKKVGVEVVEYPYASRRRADKEELRAFARDVHFVYLPPFTHADVRFVKKLVDKPLVFDPLISKYLTKVHDYQAVWKYSPRGIKNYLKDKLPLNVADFVLCDTEHHREYFSETFKVPREKMAVLPVGFVEDDFQPIDMHSGGGIFRVGFYGSFVPLQGIRKIVEAARLLKDNPSIRFEIIGKGNEYDDVYRLANEEYALDNLVFHGLLPYAKLSERLNAFDVCLGIFGDSLKAAMVVPNKVYHYAAVRKPIITRDSPGIREVFTDRKDVRLVANSPQAMVDAILELKDNHSLRSRLAKNAHETVCSRYTDRKIAETFLSILAAWTLKKRR
jgi:glycosyltransferase involved in cell wall biosynthesis